MSFHLYTISELYSNADGSIQFIEFSIGNFDGESAWSGQRLLVSPSIDGGGGGGGYGGYDVPGFTASAVQLPAAGENNTYIFPHDLPSTATANTSVLIATQSFADLGLVAPDFILPVVPDGFLFQLGGTLSLVGGDSLVYTPLPHDGTQSLNVELLMMSATPRNFAGDTATIPGNPLVGGAAAEMLQGTRSADFMVALAGDDTLTGGAGNDTLRGGPGDDTYVAERLDSLIEQAAEGHDTVRIASSWTLAEQFEALELTGTANLAGRGNALANTLTGNAGHNLLGGGDGNDTLHGGDGNDTLQGGTGADALLGGAGNDVFVVNPGDTVTERAGEGIDTVKSAARWTLGAQVETLLLIGGAAIAGTGNALANTLTGNDGANALAGGAGNDTLSGGGGNDTLRGGNGSDRLSGGTGADHFVFDAPLSAVGHIDTIIDLGGADRIMLDDDVFRAFDAGSSQALAAGRFAAGEGLKAARDADERILYDTASGALYYDADGAGGNPALQFAVIGEGSHPALDAATFRLIG